MKYCTNAQGVKNAVPKTILQLMNVEGMTRENVASHLQKYRQYLKRMAGYPANVKVSHEELQKIQQVVPSQLPFREEQHTISPGLWYID